MDKASRSCPINAIQKRMLIDYMDMHPQLRAGTFTPNFTFKSAQALWEIITIKLNAVPGGAHKPDWKMWRKTWSDIKKNTMTKAVLKKKDSQKTGGGSPTNINLNDNDLMVLELINKKKVDGMPSVPESKIKFTFNEPSTSGHMNMEDFMDLENIDEQQNLIVPENVENIQEQIYLENDGIPNLDVQMTPKGKSDDHAYAVDGLGGSNKVRRMETSLSISKKMVNQMEQKNSVKTEYYEKKIKYFEHTMRHNDNLIEVVRENTLVQRQILQVLLAKK